MNTSVHIRRKTREVKSLINSVTSDYEDRLLLQDSIDGIGRDAEAFTSYLSCMASTDKRNVLLSFYKQMLKGMICEVDTLKNLDEGGCKCNMMNFYGQDADHDSDIGATDGRIIELLGG